ncbi:hypothetical protein [Bradyrhizobium iriomotense]|uniref:hypothetical protein n=1 Tax=Bradyrhizobium iriomotense TaxID=441950 RepID=UPI001B8A3928|nr:hypothetical protein [Bradyrhizobium iriomotense]MBR1131612.1 hypothetical protein [Bradyrhizobium iriomotense]
MSLLGAWLIDDTDKVALARLGDVLLEFDENGGLRYTIREQGKRQIINLRYRVEGSTIVTDQPSAPQVERTEFSFPEDGVLTLAFGGVPYRFVRASGP